MKKVLLLAALAAFALIPLAAADDGKGPGHEGQEMGVHGMMMENGLDKALADLKLTDAQELKLREIKDASKRDIFNLRHEIQLAIMDIQDEYKKEKSDAVKINACIDKLSDAQKKLMKIRSDEMLKMKAVLTPEQFKKLIEKMEKAKNNQNKSFFDRLRGK